MDNNIMVNFMIEIKFEKNDRFIETLFNVSALNAVDSDIKIELIDINKNINKSIRFYEFQVFEFFKYNLLSLNSLRKGNIFKYPVDEGSGAPYTLHFSVFNNKIIIALKNGQKTFQGPIEASIDDYENALIKVTKDFINYILEKRPDFKKESRFNQFTTFT